MLIAICGPSGAGKSELQKVLDKKFGACPLISYTTRIPRLGEKDGEDYRFVSEDEFLALKDTGFFAEVEEYSQRRFYGTSVEDVKDALESADVYVAVATPNGLRAFSKVAEQANPKALTKVFVGADLGTRVKRYIDRVGEHNFSFDDMSEISARVNRDFGMFLNVEKEADIVFDNSGDSKEALTMMAIDTLNAALDRRASAEEVEECSREEY